MTLPIDFNFNFNNFLLSQNFNTTYSSFGSSPSLFMTTPNFNFNPMSSLFQTMPSIDIFSMASLNIPSSNSSGSEKSSNGCLIFIVVWIIVSLVCGAFISSALDGDFSVGFVPGFIITVFINVNREKPWC